jgi:CRISPR-associated protein Cas1
MAVLHLLEQGATVRLSAGRVKVELDGEPISDAPARKVTLVQVHGNVRLTTPALSFFLRSGVPVVYCSLDARVHGLAAARELATPERLRAQFAAVGTQAQLELARAFVSAKLRSSRSVLDRLAPKHPCARAALSEVDALLKRTASAVDVARLRGLEGLAARHYYQGLQGPLEPFGFTGRNRRPPRDPVNAALSYAYALLLPRVLLAVLSAGLHPEVGMLHAETRRNPALALDLMEEFRVAVVDLTVLRAFLRGTLKPLEHFEDQRGGIYLNAAGRKVLVPLIEARLRQEASHPTLPPCPFGATIERQAQQLASTLMRRGSYRPYALQVSA